VGIRIENRPSIFGPTAGGYIPGNNYGDDPGIDEVVEFQQGQWGMTGFEKMGGVGGGGSQFSTLGGGGGYTPGNNYGDDVGIDEASNFQQGQHGMTGFGNMNSVRGGSNFSTYSSPNTEGKNKTPIPTPNQPNTWNQFNVYGKVTNHQGSQLAGGGYTPENTYQTQTWNNFNVYGKVTNHQGGNQLMGGGYTPGSNYGDDPGIDEVRPARPGTVSGRNSKILQKNMPNIIK